MHATAPTGARRIAPSNRLSSGATRRPLLLPAAATPPPSDGADARADLTSACPPPPPLLAAALAVSAALVLATPRPAAAWDHPHHGFKEGPRPRRHTRPMGAWDRWAGAAERVGRQRARRGGRWADEEAQAAASSSPVAKVEAAVDAALDTAEAGVRGAGAALGAAARTAARALGVEVAGPGGSSLRVSGGGGRAGAPSSAAASTPEVITLSADRPATRLVSPSHLNSSSSYTSRLAARTPLTDSEFSVAAWVVGGAGLLSLVTLARRRGWFTGRRGRRGAGGRWVRDRSLGGKMVWVEDGGAAFSRAPRFEDDGGAGPSAGGASSYGSDFFDFEGADSQATASRAPAAAAAPAPSSSLPAWWDAPPKDPPLVASAPPPGGDPLAAGAAATARAILARLTNSKAAGVDYSLADCVALRLALAGTRVALAPSTPSIRDAIFRAAAAEAAAAGARGDGTAALGGASPAAFIAGLAADLAVPPAAAANMVSAAVAALARTLLVDALAAQRDAATSGGPEPALERLGCLVRALPFNPGAPQPPMVAAALAGRGKPEELARLAATAAGFLSPEEAGAVAELLGL